MTANDATVNSIIWKYFCLLKPLIEAFNSILPPCIGTHALGLEFGSAAQLSKRPGSVWNCLWGNALKDLLGSFVKVGYHIPVPDFYLVLHGFRCRKSTIMD